MYSYVEDLLEQLPENFFIETSSKFYHEILHM